MAAIDAIIINCDADVLEELTAQLRETEATVETSPQRHLDGQQVQDWVVVAIASTQAAPLLLRSLRLFLTRNNLTSVKYGDVEIKNPRPEDVGKLAEEINRAREQRQGTE